MAASVNSKEINDSKGSKHMDESYRSESWIKQQQELRRRKSSNGQQRRWVPAQDENAPPRNTTPDSSAASGDDSTLHNSAWAKQQQALRRQKTHVMPPTGKPVQRRWFPQPLADKNAAPKQRADSLQESLQSDGDSTVHDAEWVKQQQDLRRKKSSLARPAIGGRLWVPPSSVAKQPSQLSSKASETTQSSQAEGDSSLRSGEWVKQQQDLRRGKNTRGPFGTHQEWEGVMTSTPLIGPQPLARADVIRAFENASMTASPPNIPRGVAIEALPEEDEDDLGPLGEVDSSRGTLASVPEEKSGSASPTEEKAEQQRRTMTLAQPLAASSPEEEDDDAASLEEEQESEPWEAVVLSQPGLEEDGSGVTTSPEEAESTLPDDTAEATLPDESAAPSPQATQDTTTASAKVGKQRSAKVKPPQPSADVLPRRSSRQPKPKPVCRTCDPNDRHFY